MSEKIDPIILGVLRRANQQIRDLGQRAQAIQDFVGEEISALKLGPGDSIDLESGVITRAKDSE